MTRRIKRTMDIVGALAMLIVLAPFLLVIVALVKYTSPGPVIYSSCRWRKPGAVWTVGWKVLLNRLAVTG